ncbi:MAG: hypothetical protein P4L16_07340 [Chlamydiales bacterium]|nr:hypothetical protein [Chlamydiales bacterium]
MKLSEKEYSHAKGGLREIVFLFFPILLMTFSTCISLFVEKLLFARVSAEVMEVAVSATFACQVLQGPCVALAMMAQVYVGRWCGALEYRAIGPGVWQFIWFSCLSVVVVVPLSVLYGKFYFHGTHIEDMGLSYYYYLIGVGFLFPLGACLSCFFLGQKKVRLVLFVTIGSQLIKLLSAYFFILGVEGVFSGLGLIGGIISTLIAQGGFCLVLFFVFINLKNTALFNSRAWHFQSKLFWECIHPGLLRALNRILTFTSGATVAQLMTVKGGDYLLIFSIGGTLFIFLPFLGEAICQAQTTLVSQIIGAKAYLLLRNAFKSGLFLTAVIVAIVGIPLVWFYADAFYFLFPGIELDETAIQKIFLGIWLSFAFFAFGFVPLGYVLAFKDTRFLFFMGGINWINGFLLVYVAIEKVHIEADQFWLVLSFMHFSTFILYLWRMRWLQSRELAAFSQANSL